MREYYGDLENCYKYIEDKNHKAIPWKNSVFSFEFKNDTEYTLKLSIRGISMKGIGSDYSSMIVGPKENTQIQIRISGDISVLTEENEELKCNFTVEYGCMVARNVAEYRKGKTYIVPVFKNGIVTIVTSDDCRPNLGAKSKYKVVKLKRPAKKVKVCNFTPYDIIVSTKNSTKNKVIQKIRGRKNDEKCTSKFIGIPSEGILYIDTLFEEILWKDQYKVYGDSILRVNGCCIKIHNASYFNQATVIGPGSYTPYIRHLYACFDENSKCIKLKCNTLDDL